jgi:hypothetical protein
MGTYTLRSWLPLVTASPLSCRGAVAVRLDLFHHIGSDETSLAIRSVPVRVKPHAGQRKKPRVGFLPARAAVGISTICHLKGVNGSLCMLNIGPAGRTISVSSFA